MDIDKPSQTLNQTLNKPAKSPGPKMLRRKPTRIEVKQEEIQEVSSLLNAAGSKQVCVCVCICSGWSIGRLLLLVWWWRTVTEFKLEQSKEKEAESKLASAVVDKASAQTRESVAERIGAKK